MRPTAQVEPIALAIDADWLIRRQVFDDFCLVVLANRLEVENRRVAVPNFAANRLVAINRISRIFSSMRGRSSGVNGSARAKS